MILQSVDPPEIIDRLLYFRPSGGGRFEFGLLIGDLLGQVGDLDVQLIDFFDQSVPIRLGLLSSLGVGGEGFAGSLEVAGGSGPVRLGDFEELLFVPELSNRLIAEIGSAGGEDGGYDGKCLPHVGLSVAVGWLRVLGMARGLSHGFSRAASREMENSSRFPG